MGTCLSLAGLLDVWNLSHEWVVALSAISVLTFIGSIIALPRLLASLPEDYFTTTQRPKSSWVRNAFGVVLVTVGIAMLVLPGQGVLTILAGSVLLDFPGKSRLERRLFAKPRVLDAINRIRRRRGRAPLEMPPAQPG